MERSFWCQGNLFLQRHLALPRVAGPLRGVVASSPLMPVPLIAIVGAPNAGKSTLFNRLIRGRHAIVTAEPGATRDRIYGEFHEDSLRFRLVDTGGLSGELDTPISQGIDRQVRAAVREADGVVFLVDVRTGVTAMDQEIAAWLRRAGKPVLVVANKVETESLRISAPEFFELGLGEPIPLSAEEGSGIDGLLEALSLLLGEPCPATSEQPADTPAPIRVALVGRPNVGKSSILNRLVGEERQIVTDVPGTTRDAVDTLLERDGKRFLLVDTAGIRRPGRVGRNTEAQAVARARDAIRRADVVVLVLDAAEGTAAQDLHIAGHAQEAGRPIIVAVNKWDRVEQREDAAKEWERTIRERLRFAKCAPFVLVSALSGQRVSKILDLAEQVHEAGGIRVATGPLNRWLQEAARHEMGAPALGRSVKLYYATQTGVHPPRFVLFCSHPERVHFSLRRFLENGLRDRFGFGPAAIQLNFRGRGARKAS